VTPTVKLKCTACKGCGHIVVYENEWAEYFARAKLRWNRLIAAIKRWRNP
jgi:hypothetical protein